jgi:hypothetical protein
MDDTIYDYARADGYRLTLRRADAEWLTLAKTWAGIREHATYISREVVTHLGLALLGSAMAESATWDDVDLPRSAVLRLGEVVLEVEPEWEHSGVDEADGWRADYQLGRGRSWRKLGVWPTIEAAKSASPRALVDHLLAPLREALSAATSGPGERLARP